ncbi:MAG TPA: PRC-barrel domain-containing protein [Anaerolineales bacterium]|nr:PRC-barrel domain-containing protein [Anaerolineales bacterium]
MNEMIEKKPRISSRSLIGSVVKNMLDEDLGEIEEMLVDPETGFVSEVVLSTSKFLGFGKKIAVPWDMLKIDDGANSPIMDIDKDFLARVPSYRGS